MSKGPKILLLDIETAPIEAFVWGLFDQNISLNQIKKDWFILSWAAKWLDKKKIHYQDLRKEKKPTTDKSILKGIWELIDEADIIVGQNHKSFDLKKLNARFILNGMKPPAPYQTIDTLRLARKVFGFTSNKLAYTSENLNEKYKKLEHKKYPGQEMWTECLKGNLDAWKHMEKYNKYDVLALEELYKKLIVWDNPVNFNLYHENNESKCSCGAFVVKKWGFKYTAKKKVQRYICDSCGKYHYGDTNLLTPLKKRDLLK
jgi:hypothetical protein